MNGLSHRSKVGLSDAEPVHMRAACSPAGCNSAVLLYDVRNAYACFHVKHVSHLPPHLLQATNYGVQTSHISKGDASAPFFVSLPF